MAQQDIDDIRFVWVPPNTLYLRLLVMHIKCGTFFKPGLGVRTKNQIVL